MLAVALLLTAVFFVLVPGFLAPSSILTIARTSSIVGVLALAMGFVVIFRGLDLSLLAVMTVSASLSLRLIDSVGTGPALLVGFMLAAGLGMVNGLVIAFVEIPALFTTLATSLLFYGVARSLWLKALVVQLPDRGHLVRALGGGKLWQIPASVIVFLGLSVLVYLVLSRTTVGKFIYAHGDNPEAASLTGIATRPLTVLVYTGSACMAFVAGLITAGTAGNLNSQIATAAPITFQVLAVVVIGGISLVGGRGGVHSVLVGTFLIAVLTNGMILLNVDQNVQTIVQGLILLSAIVLDSRLHKRDEETARQGD